MSKIKNKPAPDAVSELVEDEAEPQVEVAIEAAPKGKPACIVVINVNAPMPHLLKNKMIDGPTEFECIDSFLQCQIDAGKLKLL